MFKKIAIGVMLFFMAVSVPVIVPSCNSSSSPTGPGNNSNGTSVNTPTNQYSVIVMVAYVGGLGGCAMGDVTKNVNGVSQPVTDAQVTINSVNLDTMDGMYLSTGVSTNAGTHYTLSVTEGGTTIATGTAIMPSTPVILTPADNSAHAINTSLQVAWSAVQNATSILISVAYQDTLGNDTTIYEPASLPPSQTSVTIPQTVFNMGGTYKIDVNAIYGLPPNLSVIDSTQKGYNISGPAGMFTAISEAIDTVYVNTGLLVKKSMEKKRVESARDKVLKIARKWFPGIF
ncbi:MAG: hypothetical protein WBM07_01155 [Chitinivibrionales bacterium]